MFELSITEVSRALALDNMVSSHLIVEAKKKEARDKAYAFLREKLLASPAYRKLVKRKDALADEPDNDRLDKVEDA